MTKSYDDPDFMHGEEARPLRILAEYMEPRMRLKEQSIHRAVTFWGSARIRPGHSQVADGRDYYALAKELGKRLATWTMAEHETGDRYHILTGGGPGIMTAAHEGAADVNPLLNVGFNIELPFEQSSNKFIPLENNFHFHYFFTRKFWFINLSRALVVFPGGFGTLDELFEVLTLTQTGRAPTRAVVLFGKNYWKEVINLKALARQGLITDEDVQRVSQVDCVDEAFDALVHRL